MEDMAKLIRLLLLASQAELDSLEKDSREDDFAGATSLIPVEASVRARCEVLRAWLLEHDFDTEGPE